MIKVTFAGVGLSIDIMYKHIAEGGRRGEGGGGASGLSLCYHASLSYPFLNFPLPN